MTMKLGFNLAIIIAIAICTFAASAQELGDREKGRKLAESVCAECHAIDRLDVASPNPSAPAFQELARTPGMTGIALTAALLTAHREMPHLVLPVDQREDIIAYILSLRD